MDDSRFMYSVNPATGERIAAYAAHSQDQVQARLAAAHEAYVGWSREPIAARTAVLLRAAVLLRERRDDLARLASLEMGKTLASAVSEVEKCAWLCEYFAHEAPGLLATVPVATDARTSLVRHDPLGVLLAIMPWNFPYWQAFRAAVPALAAGNTVALKHASNVCGCALAMEQLWRDAGLPPAAFTILLVPGAATTELIAHPAIAAVTLTGSEPAGVAVGEASGRALKKVVLELGGSDPFIVLADADVPEAAKQAAAARAVNNGESCIAAKRFIVVATVAEAFEEAFGRALGALRVGDPMARDTDIGPLARPDLVAELHAQVRASIDAGARLVLGGEPLAGPGAFYPPTLLTHVTPGMRVFDEETFGPVAAVTRARDTAHAIELANQSRYGLGASVWSRDVDAALELAKSLEAGSVFVNATVRSDPRLPFGGVKRSGHGRELGAWGLHEFVNRKTVWVG